MANTKLSPVEAHEILRRHVERLVSREDSGPKRQAWRVRAQTYAPGEPVLRADARVSGLALVVQGQLAVYAGRRHTIRPLVVLTPGQTFGQAAPALCPADATLKALTHCEIWFLDPATGQGLADPGPSGDQTARRTSRWARLGLVLLIVLATALVLAVPSGRAATAVLPMGLGDWCHRQAHDWCAEQAWKGAASLAPADASPLLALGMLYAQRGKMEAAERAFEEARELIPSSPEAQNNLGVLYYRRGEYGRAVDAFQQALLAEPGNATTEQNLGDSLLANHAYDEALGHYRSAISLEEPTAGTLANMAIAYFQTGRLLDAGEAAHNALRLQPELAPAYTVLGAVALDSQQPEEALTLLRRAQELGPDSGQVDYYLGRTYLDLGQAVEAESSFEGALAVTGDDRVRDQIDRYLATIADIINRTSRPH